MRVIKWILEIPIRDGFSGTVPVAGWDGKHECLGYAPYEEQPHLRNPEMK